MSNANEPRSETYLRLTARSTILALVLSLALAALFVVMIAAPASALARWFKNAPWFFPLFTILLAAGHQTWFRRNRWDPKAPEARALMNDELRQISADHAARVALMVVVLAQPLLAALLAMLSIRGGIYVMAAVTMELGVATFLSVFYVNFYAREPRDG